MKILTKFILQTFLKYFVMIFLSLEIFFVGMDYLQHLNSLPNSANLHVLYLLYSFFFTLTITLPLALVFAWLLTLVMFIKNNTLIAFGAIGVSKKMILLPIIYLTSFFLILLIVIKLTHLAYSYEQKKKILNNNYFTNTKTDIFLKYNNYYVYFEKLFSLQKKAKNIHIFKVENEDLIQTIVAKKAYFQNNKWYIVDAKITNKPKEMNLETSKLDIRYEKFLNILEGFKPKILDNVHKDKNVFSILDAILALVLLSEQNVNTNNIRAAIYYDLVPFFILPLIMLIYSYTNISKRFFNSTSFIFLFIFISLILWGIFFMLYKFSSSGIIQSELFILLPLFLWFLFSFLLYNKRLNKEKL